MGKEPARNKEEIATIRLALDLGVSLIQTTETGGEAKVISEALTGRRGQAFLVATLNPHSASAFGTIEACDRVLMRLGTTYLDMLLLNGRGPIPLLGTVEACMVLRTAGKILHFGVNDFGINDMIELWDTRGGSDCETDSIRYSLSSRGAELDLLPWLREHHLPIMAYSPLKQSRLLRDPKLKAFAETVGKTPAQVALAWLLAKDDVVAIPNISNCEQLNETAGALDLMLTPAQLAELDRLFPAPQRQFGSDRS